MSEAVGWLVVALGYGLLATLGLAGGLLVVVLALAITFWPLTLVALLVGVGAWRR